ncbi:MAG TPA: phosphoenolpyruvate carboxykinase (ATP), partial [Planctomycetaceae bacterium]|nr:phosphoenolpyruvate carboxykinase (ATP) [Planctomycetaceae bacterium]
GTEVGVTEPEATFSACFGAAFLVWHPIKYAQMLAERMEAHQAQGWLVNTGWTGGPYGVGSRIKLRYTRAIIDAIHSGELARAETVEDSMFGFAVPTRCPGVPSDLLVPRRTWNDPVAYDVAAADLGRRFQENFRVFQQEAPEEILAAAPRVPAAS